MIAWQFFLLVAFIMVAPKTDETTARVISAIHLILAIVFMIGAN